MGLICLNGEPYPVLGTELQSARPPGSFFCIGTSVYVRAKTDHRCHWVGGFWENGDQPFIGDYEHVCRYVETTSLDFEPRRLDGSYLSGWH